MAMAFPHREEQHTCSQRSGTALEVNTKKILVVSFGSQSEID